MGTQEYKTARSSVSDHRSKITKRKTRVLLGNLLPKGILEPQTRYYVSSLRYEASNLERVLHRAIRQHRAIENKDHWALDMAFNQDRLQCTNAQNTAQQDCS